MPVGLNISPSMNLGLILKNRKNKIFAIGLSAIALGFFVAGISFHFFTLGANFMGSAEGIIDIISFIFEGGILTYLLVTNIRNDSRAYMAILMWMFWFFIDEIFTILYSRLTIISFFGPNADPVYVSLSVLYILLTIASLVIGILLYIQIRRYMFMSSDRFSRIRLFAIIHAAISVGVSALVIVLEYLVNGQLFFLESLFFGLCRSLADIAICFTLERLRR